MTTTAPSLPAGWYAVPDRPNTKGYWDGANWTGDYASADSAPSEGGGAGAIVVIGYLTAVLMPLIGFILGIVVVTRPSKTVSKHGAGIILISIVAFVIYMALILHSASSSTYTTNY